MPSIHAITVQLNEEEARSFINEFQNFIKEDINPSFLGVSKILFRLELSQQGGFNVICETNKQLNQGSRSQIYALTRGFLHGWLAHKNANERKQS